MWRGRSGGGVETRLVMLGETFQNRCLPAPILKHLRGGLNKVTRAFGKASGVSDALRAKAMHDVLTVVLQEEQTMNLWVTQIKQT